VNFQRKKIVIGMVAVMIERRRALTWRSGMVRVTMMWVTPGALRGDECAIPWLAQQWQQTLIHRLRRMWLIRKDKYWSRLAMQAQNGIAV
jgi:hypothetical protein